MVRVRSSLVALLLLMAASGRAQETCGVIQITSTTGASTFSGDPAIDAVGSRIAFTSNANLAGGNADGSFEIFLWYALEGITQITGTASGSSVNPAIDAAGSRITFESNANPLGSNGDGTVEIFLWDSSSGLTQITNSVVGDSRSSSINAAGNRIAFVSNADLVGANADGNNEIFLWDSSAGLTQITNTTAGSSFGPAIDDSGNRIAFTSSSNFTGSNGDANFEIFLWDASTGLSQITTTVGGNNGSPAINATGTRIAFESNVDGNNEIFLWDSSSGLVQITQTASGNSLVPAINAAGDRIAFRSNAPLGSNSGGNLEIFLWNSSSGFTQLTNDSIGHSEFPAINAAGNRIAFHSTADLAAGNGDRNNEIFLAFCPLLIAVEIPVVSPLGLGALILLLGLAATWTLRDRPAAGRT